MADSGIATLDNIIERLKQLAGPTVGTRVAARAAPLVDEAAKKTAKAGTTPDGQPWKAKKDGGRPLANAASHIETRASGNYITVTLSGPDVFHHKGLGHAPRRQIIPDTGSVPPSVEHAVERAAKEVFDEIVGGRQ